MTEKNRSLIVQNAKQQALAEVKQFETSLLNSVAPEKTIQHIVTCRPWFHVQDFVFSPEGTYIAAASGSKLFLWNRQTRKYFQVFEHGVHIETLEVSPDGNIIAAGGTGKTIRVWDVQTGRCLFVLEAPDSHVNSLAISADGQILVSSSTSRGVGVWDLRTGEMLRTINADSCHITLSPDGSQIISAERSSICLWDAATGELVKEYEEPGYKNCFHEAVSADGHRIVTRSTYDCIIRIVDMDTGQKRELKPEQHIYSGVRSIALSPNGRLVLASEWYLRLWDIDSGTCLETLTGHWGKVAFSPGGNLFAAVCNDGITVWELKTGQHETICNTDMDSVSPMQVSTDWQTIITNNQNSFTIWSLQADQPPARLSGHKETISSSAISSCGNILASASWDETIRIWDLKTRRCLQVWHESKYIPVMSISPDSKSIAYHGKSEIILKDLRTGIVKQVIPVEDTPLCLHFTRDGNQLITEGGSIYHYIRFWDLQTGACQRSINLGISRSHQIISNAMHPKQQYCLNGEDGGVIHLWDLETGVCKKTFEGHTASVTSVAFHPDGTSIASADNKNTILLWDIHTGRCLRSFDHQPYTYWDEVAYLFISPDGRLLLSGSRGGILNFWDCETTELLGTAYNVDDGYLWTTLPDEFTGNGWLHTNRPDLLSLTAIDPADDQHIEYIRQDDEQFSNYMKLYNDGEMVMNRIFNRERYKELLQLRANNKDEADIRLLQDRQNQEPHLLAAKTTER